MGTSPSWGPQHHVAPQHFHHTARTRALRLIRHSPGHPAQHSPAQLSAQPSPGLQARQAGGCSLSRPDPLILPDIRNIRSFNYSACDSFLMKTFFFFFQQKISRWDGLAPTQPLLGVSRRRRAASAGAARWGANTKAPGAQGVKGPGRAGAGGSHPLRGRKGQNN